MFYRTPFSLCIIGLALGSGLGTAASHLKSFPDPNVNINLHDLQALLSQHISDLSALLGSAPKETTLGNAGQDAQEILVCYKTFVYAVKEGLPSIQSGLPGFLPNIPDPESMHCDCTAEVLAQGCQIQCAGHRVPDPNPPIKCDCSAHALTDECKISCDVGHPGPILPGPHPIPFLPPPPSGGCDCTARTLSQGCQIRCAGHAILLHATSGADDCPPCGSEFMPQGCQIRCAPHNSTIFPPEHPPPETAGPERCDCTAEFIPRGCIIPCGSLARERAVAAHSCDCSAEVLPQSCQIHCAGHDGPGSGIPSADSQAGVHVPSEAADVPPATFNCDCTARGPITPACALICGTHERASLNRLNTQNVASNEKVQRQQNGSVVWTTGASLNSPHTTAPLAGQESQRRTQITIRGSTGVPVTVDADVDLAYYASFITSATVQKLGLVSKVQPSPTQPEDARNPAAIQIHGKAFDVLGVVPLTISYSAAGRNLELDGVFHVVRPGVVTDAADIVLDVIIGIDLLRRIDGLVIKDGVFV